jgi:hypothetical protein
MERTKKVNQEEVQEEVIKTEPVVEAPVEEQGEQKRRYKKIGGGSLRLRNRLIPPGAEFLAYPSELPKGSKDVVIPLDGDPAPKKEPVVEGQKSLYSIQPRGKSKSMFDVFGPNGKRINDQPLAKAVAERLKEDLEQ